MKIKIIKIGNSQGIRIPKSILEQTGLNNEVELEVEKDSIVIRPITKNPRQGWDKAFIEMARNKDDQLLDQKYLSTQSNWVTEEWDW